ncbi:MAG: PEP-CTERM sorting domain-containing protein [Candidatus Auribacterota bacterium]
MKMRWIFVVLLAASLLSQKSYAAPVQWAENGHWYELIGGGRSWNDARIYAQSSSYDDMPGYLVTLTTPEEDAWIRATLGVGNYWLGAYQPDGSPEPIGGYCWVTGEDWTWNDRNKADNTGSVLYYYPDKGAYWDDDSPTGYGRATLIEYGTYFDDGIHGNAPVPVEPEAAIPEPMSLAALLIGLACYQIRKRLK